MIALTKSFLFVLTAGCLLSAPFQSANPEKRTTDTTSEKTDRHSVAVPSTQNFFNETGAAHANEIRIAEVAVTHASRQEVKDLAQQLVTDHRKGYEDLKALANRKGVTIAEEPLREKEATPEKKDQAAESSFDRSFLEKMDKSHAMKIEKMKAIAEKHTDADVRDYAQKAVPVLERHHQQIVLLKGTAPTSN